MVHEHYSLVGGLIRQAGSQTDSTAREDGLGVWLLLLMQKGVACHLHTATRQRLACVSNPRTVLVIGEKPARPLRLEEKL